MKYFLQLLLTLSAYSVNAQFQTNGVATSLGGGVYQMTPATNAVFGAIWYKLQHNLNNPFNVQGQMNFGTDPAGADGISFVMQNGCLSAGGAGGGIGYLGIPGQSLGIEFDTYQNIVGTGTEVNNDPVYDHIAVEKNGHVVHDGTANAITAPTQMDASLTNVKNGNWYDFRIHYNPATRLLRVFFNGSLRVNITYDIQANVFGGNQWVYWGFTSSTGGHFNVQQVSINGTNSTHLLGDTTICTGSIPIVLNPLANLRGTNLALNNPGNASSLVPDVFKAFDGNLTTRWSGNWTDTEWIQVDLQSPTNIDSVTLDWEAAFATNYLIQTSSDAVSWTTRATITGGDGAHDKIIFSAPNVRYVRMQTVLRGLMPYGPSLWEFSVYGQPNYLWSTNNGTNASISPNIYSSSVTLSPAVTTTYTVMIPDACLGYTNYSMTVTISCPSPVTLLNFEVSEKETGAELVWSTVSEENSSHFEILRSTDGIHFESIGIVPASQNSSSISTYSFNDETTISGTVYYQLVAVDRDGSREEKGIRTLQRKSEQPFVLQTIFENETAIQVPASEDWIEYAIVNTLGQMICRHTIQNPSSILIGRDLAPGGYLVQIRTQTGQVVNRICKVR